ncbi:MAG: hypothetical protein JXR40_12445 [Pontiellaceae bacterium]|nr:hypothetical protein [Pontiellaceae bacterium]
MNKHHILPSFLLLASGLILGCSSLDNAAEECPSGHRTLSTIPVFYKGEYEQLDSEIQQSLQSEEYSLQSEKYLTLYFQKDTKSPETTTTCTTCGFTYQPHPREYWLKYGKSFDEFRIEFASIFMSIDDVLNENISSLTQCVKNEQVTRESMTYLVENIEEPRTIILNTLASLNIELQEIEIDDDSYRQYIFKEGNSIYTLYFAPWYSLQWSITISRKVNIN